MCRASGRHGLLGHQRPAQQVAELHRRHSDDGLSDRAGREAEEQYDDQSSDCAAGSPGVAPTEAASSVTSIPGFTTIAAPDDAD